MAELVAIRLPDIEQAVTSIRQTWSAGDAVLVLDPKAPEAATTDLLRRVRPTALVHTRPDGSGPRVTRLDGVSVADGTAAVVMTSGSTGAPRAIVLSTAAMDASAVASVDRLGCRPGDRWLLCLPLHHVAGLAVLRRAHHLGSVPDVHGRFDVEAVATSTAQWWPLVPTMLRRLLEAGTDLAGRGILLGGAAADPMLVAAARDAGATVTVGYGMTETGGGCVYDGWPLDDVEVALADNGRIRLRGPVLADGRRRADGTVEPVTDENGWLTTGDIGRWDEHRRLVVEGRADHVIVTGGENVAPDAVERALVSHPGVADAAVLGRPDPEWGQTIVALVVPADPHRPPSLADLRDHVGATLGRHAAPRMFHIVEAIPRTNLGKVARASLADLATALDR